MSDQNSGEPSKRLSGDDFIRGLQWDIARAKAREQLNLSRDTYWKGFLVSKLGYLSIYDMPWEGVEAKFSRILERGGCGIPVEVGTQLVLISREPEWQVAR